MSSLASDGFEARRRHASTILNFQVLGERCSGTNIVRWLMANNLGIRHRQFCGWKHGFPSAMGIASHSLVVCVFRDGVSWLESLHRKPFHTRQTLRGLEFAQFIRQPWDSIIDRPSHMGFKSRDGIAGMALQKDRHPLTGEMFANACALRNAKNSGFLSYERRDVNYCFVRMEDFLADKAGALGAIAGAFDLPFDGQVTDSEGDMGSGSFTGQKRADFVPEPEDLAFIRAQLDPQIEARLGYRY